MLVGIPTLNRYDLLSGCLEHLASGTVPPTWVVVVDNGRTWRDPGGWPFPLWVVRPDRNLGVAASWNLLHRIAGDRDTLFLNDDVCVASDTLARMIACPEPFVAVCDTPGFEARRDDPSVRVSDWSCFLQRREVWNAVGEYDETFWPGGYEDADYWRRMTLAGFSVTRLPELGLEHRVSATIAAMSPLEQEQLSAATRRNEALYRQKWGGPPGRETLKQPTNME